MTAHDVASDPAAQLRRIADQPWHTVAAYRISVKDQLLEAATLVNSGQPEAALEILGRFGGRLGERLQDVLPSIEALTQRTPVSVG